MEVIKIREVIDKISTKFPVPEEQKERLANELSSRGETEVIKELANIVYRVFHNQEDNLLFSLEAIRTINPNICPPVEQMKEILDKQFANEISGNMTKEENNKLVLESLKEFTKLLNEEGIDYYVVGALPTFLKIGQPLFRYHDDIDIMVKEEDIPRLKAIMESKGYSFQDDRFPTPERVREMQEKKPPHTVMAQNPDNEFHLGFFTFRRESDGSIIDREYTHRIENGEVVVDVRETRMDPVLASLRYDDEHVQFEWASFRCCSPEYTYILKGYTKRQKDYTDMDIIRPKLNMEKLAEIEKHPITREIIHGVKEEDLDSKQL